MFRKLCGESTLKNVVLVTNMWEEGPQDINEARERELSHRFFKPALDKGAQLLRHHNTAESAHDILRKIMGNHPVVLQIQRELVDERKDIINTAAGELLNQELRKQIKRHQRELMELREEMSQALKMKDNEYYNRKMKQAARDVEEKMAKMRKDTEKMSLNYVRKFNLGR